MRQGDSPKVACELAIARLRSDARRTDWMLVLSLSDSRARISKQASISVIESPSDAQANERAHQTHLYNTEQRKQPAHSRRRKVSQAADRRRACSVHFR